MGSRFRRRTGIESEGKIRMKNLIDIINKYKVSDYKITEKTIDSYQLFFVHENLETVRRSVTTDKNVTIYQDHDGFRGNSSFSVYGSDTPEVLCDKVEKAISNALLINDKAYTLPESEKESFEIKSNIADVSFDKLASDVAKVVFDASRREKGGLNAVEIFINKIDIHVVNSRGIDKSQRKYNIEVEAIPTFNGEKESVELYQFYTSGDYNPQTIADLVKEKMADVEARSIATKPEGLNCKIILHSSDLQVVFAELVRQLNYSSIYGHTNLHSVGDDIQKDSTGDKINVTMRGVLDGVSASSHFDGDGTKMVDCKVIEDGKIISAFGDNRFAQYLGEKTTGALSIMDVEGGKEKKVDLEQGEYLECVFFSGIQVDLYGDYIGGEVRLAYHCKDGVKTPVTGISISGKLSEVINTIKLSSEKEVDGRYFGPTIASLEKMSIY